MTSIEWLVEQIIRKHPIITQFLPNYNFDKEIINQAKLLHKQEIIKAFDESENYYYQYLINHKPKIDSETYYQESKGKIKFTEEEWSELNNGSKGSDSDISKMVEDDVEKLAKEYAKQYDYAEDSSPHLDFVAGYNKKETLYTEEQVREALKYGVDNSEIIKRGCKDIEGFIQSLKQPKKD